MDVQYECDNAFPNLKCVTEPLFLEKSTLYTYVDKMIIHASGASIKFNIHVGQGITLVFLY